MGSNAICRLLLPALWLLPCLSAIAQQFGKDTLKGVTVTARKPLVTRKTDRFIINVAESFLANGRTGLEVLQHAPGIWVDAGGAIRLQGNKPVTIMINQRVLRMSQDELADYLRSLKSEDISRIEVIQNPSAEFEANAGGIIHIILKKPVTDGVKGFVNAQYRQQGNTPYKTLGTTIDYKAGNDYIQGTYTYSNDKKELVEDAFIIYKGKGEYRNHTNRAEATRRNAYRFALAYDLNAAHSIGIEITPSASRANQFFYTASEDAEAGTIVKGNVQAERQRTLHFNSYAMNYAWKLDTIGSAWKWQAEYTAGKREEYTGFTENYTDPAQNRNYYNKVRALTAIFTAQSDYNKKTIRKLGIQSRC